MPCFRPLAAYRSRFPNKSGKHGLVFNRRDSLDGTRINIACGQCIGCRLERSRQWAMRCVHEAQLHEDNSFITLTYDDAHLPFGGSLDRKAFPLFMKRLRKRLAPLKVMYFSCGEYGSKLQRPHYHACIFGYSFPDKQLWTIRNKVPLYRSALLESCWTLGHSSVGDVTFESAAYVARYIVKKWIGDGAAEHYERVDPETGEVFSLVPEFTTMSLKPAIGKKWFEQYSGDVYPSDEVILRGKKLKPPRYYNGLYDLSNPTEMEEIKRKRVRAMHKQRANNTPERLAVREECKKLQARNLIRPLED